MARAFGAAVVARLALSISQFDTGIGVLFAGVVDVGERQPELRYAPASQQPGDDGARFLVDDREGRDGEASDAGYLLASGGPL